MQIAVLITYREILGHEPEYERLAAILSKYKRSEVVFLLAKVNSILGTWQNTPNFQGDAKLTELFLPKYCYQIGKLRQTGGRVIFSRVTLLYLIKQACLVCPAEGVDCHTSKAISDLGIVFLMANDLLLPFVPSPSDGTIEKVANTLPFSDYYPHDSYVNDIARSQKLFDDVSQRVCLKTRSDFLDLSSLFDSSLGISHSRFSQLVFGCSTKFLDVKLEDLPSREAMIVRSHFFQRSAIPNETAERFFRETAISIEELAEKMKSTNRPADDFTLLQAFPLIKLAEGIYTCLDPGFLVDKAGRGLYWTLFAKLPSKQRERLASFWGAVFELYVNSIIDQSYQARGRFTAEPKFSNGDQAFDACLLEGSNLIVFEHKSSTLRADSKYGGDVSRLRQELDLKFVKGHEEGKKGLAQLARSVLRFVDGEDVAQVTATQVRKIYPVLVCLDASVSVPYMGRYFNERFQASLSRKKLKQTMTPVFTLNISDIENLSAYLYSFRLSDIFDSFYTENRKMLTSLSHSKVPLLQNAEAGPNFVKQGFSEFARRMEAEMFPDESRNAQNPQ